MKDRIIAVREKLGLNQTDFAKKIGVSRSNIASLEVGQNPVQERHIKLIKAAFPQVNETWLRDGTGEMFVPLDRDEQLEAALAKTNLPEVAKQCVRVYEKASPELRSHLDRYLKNLLEDIMHGYPEAAVPANEPEPSRDELEEKMLEQYRTVEVPAEKKDVFPSLEHGS